MEVAGQVFNRDIACVHPLLGALAAPAQAFLSGPAVAAAATVAPSSSSSAAVARAHAAGCWLGLLAGSIRGTLQCRGKGAAS